MGCKFLDNRANTKYSTSYTRCRQSVVLIAPKEVEKPSVSTPTPAAANDSIISISSVSVSESAARPLPLLGSRRDLSFDDAISEADSQGELELECYEGELDIDPDMPEKFPASCLWEVLRRLPPVGFLSASMVCKVWRETTKKLWRVAEGLQLRVPAKAQIGFFGSMLQKCPRLIKLYYNGK
ncbi:F-box/LRR-repeat protein 17-like [Forsythia ovata]|uniref:F-box/LRR-repeat protein 17-like n=1 Tax=Forsythia ovata TaxID=205694 RepID=A0ABD1U861_9LAMI